MPLTYSEWSPEAPHPLTFPLHPSPLLPPFHAPALLLSFCFSSHNCPTSSHLQASCSRFRPPPPCPHPLLRLPCTAPQHCPRSREEVTAAQPSSCSSQGGGITLESTAQYTASALINASGSSEEPLEHVCLWGLSFASGCGDLSGRRRQDVRQEAGELSWKVALAAPGHAGVAACRPAPEKESKGARMLLSG